MSDAVITAAIVAVPPTIMAIAAFWKARQTHLLVNSRMGELLELTRKSSKAEGVKEEKEKTIT